MKNFIRSIMCLSIVALMGSGCTKNFDKINSNPDESTESDAPFLATNMLTSITSSDIATSKGFCQPFMLGNYVLWTEMEEDYQYNKLGRAGFGRLAILRNVPVMRSYAASKPEKIKNAYDALGHFIRAWQFYQVTMQVGDIPYSEAIKGESDDIIKPKYDTQKEVFIGILNELDSANTLFAEGEDFSGDFIYDGSVDKWQRLTNSFELQVLMQLYKKTGDPDLQVKKRFKDIALNRPLMRGYDDNFAVKYKNSAGYAYPWSNTPVQINSFTIYPEVGATLIQPLKNLQDRRLFYYAEPAPAKIQAGKSPSDWDAYIGIDASEPNGVTKVARSEGKFCDFNKRYADLYNAEPVGLLNYWDVQFILAEGAVRGWLPPSSAEDYYEAGIKGSMHFLAHYTPETYNHDMPLTDAYIQQYVSNVALTGSKENKIKQIIIQKYLAGFLQDCDYTAWYEHRRTGYPKFKLNTSTNRNEPSDKFPLRWRYPSDELDYNADNVAEAIQRQYGGDDNVNKKMWILKD
ncbi:MAG TPA: SusD/RagB family nutrient-binding outer membrane lipoprotein [Chitinophagaceae bacterium]|nr:SusD/RagB family nutrient-binding outer membrane lipoprotein [Chitinophagaceae bacterium]